MSIWQHLIGTIRGDYVLRDCAAVDCTAMHDFALRDRVIRERAAMRCNPMGRISFADNLANRGSASER